MSRFLKNITFLLLLAFSFSSITPCFADEKKTSQASSHEAEDSVVEDSVTEDSENKERAQETEGEKEDPWALFEDVPQVQIFLATLREGIRTTNDDETKLFLQSIIQNPELLDEPDVSDRLEIVLRRIEMIRTLQHAQKKIKDEEIKQKIEKWITTDQLLLDDDQIYEEAFKIIGSVQEEQIAASEKAANKRGRIKDAFISMYSAYRKMMFLHSLDQGEMSGWIQIWFNRFASGLYTGGVVLDGVLNLLSLQTLENKYRRENDADGIQECSKKMLDIQDNMQYGLSMMRGIRDDDYNDYVHKRLDKDTKGPSWWSQFKGNGTTSGPKEFRDAIKKIGLSVQGKCTCKGCFKDNATEEKQSNLDSRDGALMVSKGDAEQYNFYYRDAAKQSNLEHYKVLGVSKDATIIEIRKAHKKLSLQCHPDKNFDNFVEANEMQTKLNVARKVLLDDIEKRKEYDEKHKGGRGGCPGADLDFYDSFDAYLDRRIENKIGKMIDKVKAPKILKTLFWKNKFVRLMRQVAIFKILPTYAYWQGKDWFASKQGSFGSSILLREAVKSSGHLAQRRMVHFAVDTVNGKLDTKTGKGRLDRAKDYSLGIVGPNLFRLFGEMAVPPFMVKGAGLVKEDFLKNEDYVIDDNVERRLAKQTFSYLGKSVVSHLMVKVIGACRKGISVVGGKAFNFLANRGWISEDMKEQFELIAPTLKHSAPILYSFFWNDEKLLSSYDVREAALETQRTGDELIFFDHLMAAWVGKMAGEAFVSWLERESVII